MSISYSRSQLADGIGYTAIIDPKFKTNTIRLRMITELNEQNASKNAVAIEILGSSNSKYKNLTEISAKLNALYGTNMNMDITKYGDAQILSISINYIDDKFAFDGENISNEALNILMDCLFSPNVQNSEFSDEIFNFRKKDLLDSIDAEINNKRGYAILQAQKLIYDGEPSRISSYGSKQTAEKVTAANAYESYLNLIKDAQIEIYFVGSRDIPEIKEKLADAFSHIERDFKQCTFDNKSPLKKEVCNVTEKIDVNQTKVVMAFKSQYSNTHAIKLMSTIFGETPFSKLFANVREKLSLCYYCASGYNDSKGTMIVDCGVENENVEKAKAEIINQLNDIKSGNFTDEEMTNSVLSITNSLKSIGDTPSSLDRWYFGRMCRGEVITPEEEINRIKAVSREQIIEAAKSFEMDTVYVMTGEGE